MFKILFCMFLTIPLIEIAILIEIGKVVGATYTIILVIGTAALGAALLRQQGLSTIAKVQRNMNQGSLPAIELIEGLMLLVRIHHRSKGTVDPRPSSPTATR